MSERLHVMTSLVRRAVITGVDTLLYGALRQHQQQELEVLIQRNEQLHGKSSQGFVYQTIPYLVEHPQYHRVLPLHDLLLPDFTVWQVNWQTLFGNEATKVNLYLRRATVCCNFEEELFQIVPESLHDVIQQQVFQGSASALPLSDPESSFSFQKLFADVQANYPGMFELMAARRVTNILLGYSEVQGD